MKKILIVEDEKDIAELISYNLKREGFDTRVVTSGEKAVAAVLKETPDLVILDLMLPGVDGLEICKQLKYSEKTKKIPILIVTAKTEEHEIVLGLELGADDYLTKPFSPRVLVARAKAVIRKYSRQTAEETTEQTIIKTGNILIDLSRYRVEIEGKKTDLSATEFNLLAFLARNRGWVFSRNQIIEAVKGSDYPVTERSVDVQIVGLRKKLGEAGSIIETIRGIGYRLKEEDD